MYETAKGSNSAQLNTPLSSDICLEVNINSLTYNTYYTVLLGAICCITSAQE